jgi:hypothetical protein
MREKLGKQNLNEAYILIILHETDSQTEISIRNQADTPDE